MNSMAALNELRQFVYWLFGGGIIRDRDHYRKMIGLIDRAETEIPTKCPHCGVDLK